MLVALSTVTKSKSNAELVAYFIKNAFIFPIVYFIARYNYGDKVNWSNAVDTVADTSWGP